MMKITLITCESVLINSRSAANSKRSKNISELVFLLLLNRICFYKFDENASNKERKKRKRKTPIEVFLFVCKNAA